MKQDTQTSAEPTKTVTEPRAAEMGNVLFYSAFGIFVFASLYFRWFAFLTNTIGWGLIITCVVRAIIGMFRIANLNKPR